MSDERVTPAEFRQMVQEVRNLTVMIGDLIPVIKEQNAQNKRIANGQFGLCKDLRKWYGDRLEQPVLPVDKPVEISGMTSIAKGIGASAVACKVCGWKGIHMEVSDHFGREHPGVNINGQYEVVA